MTNSRRKCDYKDVSALSFRVATFLEIYMHLSRSKLVISRGTLKYTFHFVNSKTHAHSASSNSEHAKYIWRGKRLLV